MSSSPIVRGRGATATLRKSAVIVDRDQVRTTIPFEVIQEARVGGRRARTVEIVLTDGVTHELRANNASSATAFAAAVSAGLPVEPDPRGSGLVRTKRLRAPEAPPLFTDWRIPSAVLCGAVAYCGYLIYLGVAHSSELIIGAVVGLFPLVLGSVGTFMSVKHLCDRVVLRRRGVTVEAVSAHKLHGRSEYRFIDGEGSKRTFKSALNTGILEVTYDPRNSKRMAANIPLLLAVPVTVLKLAVALGLVAVGVVAAFSPVIP
ncbi:hypothetical protein OG890_01985 [Streptomyces anulatus]|uniref:hypothetical protein n=1 Tax=Streptomyces anulatus TaxID=1892 RepID=UPI002256B124|nr:hypothetical protein [Streptomyces anulatus]MCX4482724.1 hypothetical protein [Streptomyces anulatus]